MKHLANKIVADRLRAVADEIENDLHETTECVVRIDLTDEVSVPVRRNVDPLTDDFFSAPRSPPKLVH